MATIYKFEVKCVSPFVKLSNKTVSDIIENALKTYQNESGLKLESIEIKENS